MIIIAKVKFKHGLTKSCTVSCELQQSIYLMFKFKEFDPKVIRKCLCNPTSPQVAKICRKCIFRRPKFNRKLKYSKTNETHYSWKNELEFVLRVNFRSQNLELGESLAQTAFTQTAFTPHPHPPTPYVLNQNSLSESWEKKICLH